MCSTKLKVQNFYCNQTSQDLRCLLKLVEFYDYKWFYDVAQWLEHCVSSAKVVGSIPREHMYWQKKMYNLNALQVALDKSVC